jgi:hypothetical protein
MRSTTIALIAAAALTLAACGDDETAAEPTTPTTAASAASAPPEPTTIAPEPTVTPSTIPDTTVPDTTVAPTTVAQATVPSTTVIDEAWREQVDEFCTPHWLEVVALPPPAADPADLEAYAQAHLQAWNSSPDIGAIELPPGPGRTPADIAGYVAAQQVAIDDAVAAAAAGNQTATVAAIDAFRRRLGLLASAFAAAGQTCGPCQSRDRGQRRSERVDARAVAARDRLRLDMGQPGPHQHRGQSRSGYR